MKIKHSKLLTKTVLIDLVTIFFIMFLFLTLGNSVKDKTLDATQGKTIEQIKIDLVSSTKEAEQLTKNIKGLVFILIGGLILATLLTIAAMTYSRMYIWDKLINHNFKKKYAFKWLAILILTAVILFVAGLGAILLRLILNLVVSFTSDYAIDIYVRITNMLFFVAFMFLYFIILNTFSKTKKVFESIGKSFENIKQNFKTHAKKYLRILIFSIVLSLITHYVMRLVIYQSQWIITLTSSIFLLTLVGVTRIYLTKYK